MQYQKVVYVGLILLTLLVVSACGETISRTASNASAQGATSPNEVMPPPETVLLATEQLQPAPTGLEEGVVTYTTPVITATQPFNYAVPNWQVELPAGGSVQVIARTGTLTGAWSEWQVVEPNIDASDIESNTIAGMMVGPTDNLSLHERIQLGVTLTSSAENELPTIESLSVTFINSTGGATTQEILDNRDPSVTVQDVDGDYPKPPVISRAQWCFDPACNYAGVDYWPVSHLIVHHTVSNNDTTDWAANVRAIWSFHTFTNGWGDVGYNYLIDPNGNIYEGHLGGDDVIGTHATSANTGSMGVALLGTFSDVTPPEPMIEALAELLAWKSDQKEIDLWDASRLPQLDWGHLHLAGHRDMFGATVCPGTVAHGQLANVRQRVADKIGFVPEYTYIDDQDPEFTLSNANWHEGPFNCGFNAHAFFTFSTTDAGLSVNWGEWRPTVATTGVYEVDAFVPFCNTGSADSAQAPYTITHANGSTDFSIDHNSNLGLWIPLGEYTLNAGNNNVVHLGDLTASEDGAAIWFDAIRYRPLDISVVNVAPAPDVWLTDRVVTFRWQTNFTGGELKVQVSADSSFNTPILDHPVTGNTHTHTFDQDFADLHWRLQLTEPNGNIIHSAPTNFHLDATPPTSSVHTLHHLCNGDFELFWDGNDNLNGIDHFDISYKATWDNAWTPLLNDITLTTVTFTPPNPNATYLFRSQAVDGIGNTEPDKPDGDISEDDAIPCEIAPPSNVTPPTDVWVNERTVTFAWSIESPQAVTSYQLEVASDPAFSQIVANVTIDGSVTSRELVISRDHPELYWRVTATTILGGQFTSDTTRFFLDATAPASRIQDIWENAVGDYVLFWNGFDATSGLVDYTVEYLTVGMSQWSPVVINTTATSITFRPASDTVHLFRTRARDVAGNVEVGSPAGDMSSEEGCPYVSTPPPQTAPTANQWLGDLAVTFNWDIPRLECITATQIEVATDSAMLNIIHAVFFNEPATEHTHTFTEPFGELYWRISQTNLFGEAFTSEPARFRFDLESPQSTVAGVESISTNTYRVIAEGNDELSGLAGYNFEYRADGSDNWIRWAVSPSNEAIFNAPDPNTVYWFRTLAIDIVGNIESPDSDGDLNTDDARAAHELYFPIIFHIDPE